MSDTPIDPASLLPRFGLKSFRPGQREVIDAIASGRDVLCVMPTGGGKSLCFQLPSLARQGTTIVVSPLIALMKDQVDTLHRRGISAMLINSSLSPAEQEDATHKMASGALDLVYVAPERLRNSRFLDAVSQAGVTLLAIDEAHCVSEWGHDFRPDYARLGQFRNRYLSGVQTIALTATATPHVRKDIQSLLGMKSPLEFVTGFARDNLRFSVEHFKTDREKNDALLAYVEAQPGAGIIYASTRKRCEEIADWLPKKLGRPIGAYHAGLDSSQRHAVQNRFMSGELPAIVATNAFGMGIDKSDIRYVVHYNIPGSLEAYYQEAGRAGRDGKMSECRLLFAYADRYVQEFFIENRYPSPETVRKVYQYLLSRPEDPIELTLDQVRDALGLKETSESVGTAETLIAKAGVLKRLDNSANTAMIRIDSDLPTLVDLLPRESKLRRKVLRAAERVIGSHRGEDVYVRPQKLADLAGIDREQLTRTLRELLRLKQFDYVPPFRGRAVHFTQRNLTFDQLKIDFDELAKRKAAEYEKLEAVIEFARTARCRQRAVLDYFGDPNVSDCKRCDRCDPAGESMKSDADSGANLGVVSLAGNAVAGIAVPGVKRASRLEVNHVIDYDLDAYGRGIRILLSGIARMHGRFGKAMISQMLGGSNNKKIQQWKLNRLSTYGMLGGLTQPQLTDLLDAVIEVGLAAQTEVEDRRPTVGLTPDGEAVMRARQPIPAALKVPYPLAKRLALICEAIEGGDVSGEASASISSPSVSSSSNSVSNNAPSKNSSVNQPEPRTQPVASSKSKENDEGAAIDSAAAAVNLNTELMDRMKRWRGKTSAALGIPAYRVISNATIERVASQLPKSIVELEAIQGVGSSTIEQFGYDLMRLIQGSQQSSEKVSESPQITPAKVDVSVKANVRVKGDVPVKEEVPAKTEAPAKAHAPAYDPDPGDAYWTWRLFRDGYTWPQVAQIRGRSSLDVAQDLIVAAKTGHVVQASWGIGVTEADVVLPWVAQSGQESKQPLAEVASRTQA